MGFAVIFAVVDWSKLLNTTQMYWVYIRILGLPCTWFLLVLVIVVALLPDIVIRVLAHHYTQLQRYFKSVFMPEYRQRPRIFFLFSKRSGELTVSQINMIAEQ